MSTKYVFPAGRKKFIVTSVTLVNNTALTIDTTVADVGVALPANLRLRILSIKVMNPDNVNRGVTIDHYTTAAKTILVKRIATNTVLANGGRMQWPRIEAADAAVLNVSHPLILDSGETIEVVWGAGGASAGGVDADGLVFECLEMEI